MTTMRKMVTSNKTKILNNCVKIMCLLIWRRVKNLLKYMYRVNLKLVWIGCVVLIVFIVWTPGSVQKDIPVIVWWTAGFPGPKDERTICGNVQCHVTSDVNVTASKIAYLFYGSNLKFDNLPLRKRFIWGLYHEESPRNVEVLMHEKALNLFNYSSTFSRHSDVPFVLQYLYNLDDIVSVQYYVPTKKKNRLLEDISPVLYLQSDCETMTERDNYVAELMNHIDVDSYGKCLNNKRIPDKFRTDYLNNLDNDEFLRFVARYKFTIAIENGVCDDYITEKLWRTIKVGSVPLYFGSRSIADWLPNRKSAILLQDYSSPKAVADYIKLLMSNDSLYEEHLDHKIKNKIENKKLIEEFEVRPHASDASKSAEDFECFICDKLYKREEELTPSVVNKLHYDCPKPTSMLDEAGSENSWVYSWDLAGKKAENLYKTIMSGG